MRPFVVVAIACTARLVSAQVPPKLGYNGRLLRADGTPEAGVVSMSFWVHDSPTGSTALGCDELQIALSDGYYTALLGGVGGCIGGPPAIAPGAFDGRDLYLEVAIGGARLAPRQRIASVPYAFRAGTAANLRGGTVDATSATIGGASGVTISGSGISVGSTAVIDGSGKATVATGAGLSGNGSTASPLAVSFGAAGGTAVEGNDPRLSDARDPRPGGSAYVQNQAAGPQTAAFNISGGAIVGTDLGVGVAAVAAGTKLDVGGAASVRGSLTLNSNELVAFRVHNASSDPVTCDATKAGFVYFHSTGKTFFGCTGSAFVEFAMKCPNNPSAPGQTCKAIKQSCSGALDGLYWLDPNGGSAADAFAAYCDMTTDGGGWVLAMQIVGGATADGTLGYQSPHWTTASTLNDSPPAALSSLNAKFATFNTFVSSSGTLIVEFRTASRSTAGG